jgi:hypothetical protein
VKVLDVCGELFKRYSLMWKSYMDGVENKVGSTNTQTRIQFNHVVYYMRLVGESSHIQKTHTSSKLFVHVCNHTLWVDGVLWRVRVEREYITSVFGRK